MDTTLIVKAAFATVGVVQMLKNIITLRHKKLWMIPTIVLAVVFTLPCIHSWVLDTVLTISGATLFYDTIVKAFEKLFSKSDSED